MIDLKRVLTKDINEAVKSLVEDEGWRLPVFLVVVGSSGSLRYFKFRRTRDGFVQELLALVDAPNGLDHKVNLIFADANGQTCLAEKATPEPEPWAYGGVVH